MVTTKNLNKYRGMEQQWSPEFKKQICDGGIIMAVSAPV